MNPFLSRKRDGKERKSTNPQLTILSSVAVGTDGTIYAGTPNTLLAVNADGTAKWTYPIGGVGGSPAIGSDGTIYVAASDSNLYAVQANGSLKWTAPIGKASGDTPAISPDGTIYVGCLDHKMYAVNPDGTPRWSFTGGDQFFNSDPAIGTDGTIYINCLNGICYAINPDGTQKWVFTSTSPLLSPAIGADGTVYIGSEDSNFYALNNSNGTVKWKFATQNCVDGCPAIGADGTIYVGSGDHNMYAITPGGTLKWSFATAGWIASVPAIGPDGTLYFGSDDGNFYAIGTAVPTLTLTKSASLTSAAQGAVLTYTLAYANTGSASATNVALTDTLPAYVTYISGSASNGGTYNNGTLTFNLGTLAPNQSGQVTFQVAVNANATVGSQISNTATIASTEVTTPVVSNTATVSVTVSQRGDWWMLQHDRQHTGRSPFVGPATPTQKWVYQVPTANPIRNACPTMAADGTLYFGSLDNNTYALNPDGTLKWTYNTGLVVAAPAIGPDGTIYVDSSFLYAFNPNGTLKWKAAGGSGTSPAIAADGTIYSGAGTNMYAFNPDGTQKWTYATGDYIDRSSPAIGLDGTIYFGSCDNKVYALTPDGNLKWSFTTQDDVRASPAIGADGTIYVGSFDGNLYALDPNGNQKWAFHTGGRIWGCVAIATDGTLYVGSLDNNIYAVNSNGTQQWVFHVPSGGLTGVAATPLIDANGTIYCGSEKGIFYAINPNGSQKWAFTMTDDLFGAASIGPDGTLYFGEEGGKLYAIGGTSTPNLTLSKSVSQPSAAPKATVTYTLTYANTGSAAATNVVISDQLPAGITYVPGSASGLGVNYNGSTRTLSWSLPTVAAGASTPLTFLATVDANATGTISNTATIAATGVNTVTSAPATLTVNANGRGDWWMFQHDPQHTGRSAFTGPSAPVQKWAFPAGGTDFYTAPAAIAADGTIYVGISSGGTSNRLVALNPDGTQQWTFSVPNQISSSPAIGADGTIYLANHNLYALNPDGTAKWTSSFTVGNGSSPVIGSDGTIYIENRAVNPDGSAKWQSPMNGGLPSAALAADGTVYIAGNNLLSAFKPDGTLIWNFVAGDTIYSSPTVGTDGTIYIGSIDNKLYAVNADGTQKWAFTADSAVYSTPALAADGTIYFGSQFNIYALDANGNLLHSAFIPIEAQTSPIIGADGTIYLGANTGILYAFNPDLSTKWTYTLAGIICASPAIGANGTLYIGSMGGNFYALGNNSGLTITKSVSPTGALVGSTVTYTITYANSGASAATNVLLTDLLPTGLSYVDPSASNGGTYNALTNTLSWSLGTLNPNDSGQVTFQATVTSLGSGSGGSITNTAQISSREIPTPVVSNGADLTVSMPNDWFMFQHDPQHTGRSPFTGPSNNPVKRWTKGGGSRHSPPVVGSNGIIYSIAGNTLQALDSSGVQQWVNALSSSYSYSAPAIAPDGTIYVDLDYLYAVTPSGNLKWKSTFPVSNYVSPLIAPDGTIYVTDDTSLIAASPNGALLWSLPVYQGSAYSYYGESSPALGTDGTIYVGSFDNQLYAVNPNGTVKWTFKTGSIIYSSPSIAADGTIYIGSDDCKLYAINPDSSLKWQYTTNGHVTSTAAIATDGTVYFVSKDSTLYAVDQNGTLKWTAYVEMSASEDSDFHSPLIDANGTVYFGDDADTGQLQAFDPDGTRRWIFYASDDFESCAALASDGTLYIASLNGNLYAIGGNSGPQYTLTPSAGANGAIYPSTPQLVSDGTNFTFTAAPAVGYEVDQWLVDGTVAQTGMSQFTLVKVTANHNVQVTFKQLMFTITPSSDSNGGISPSTPQTIAYDGSVTFTAVPNTGYDVDTWLIDGSIAQVGGTQLTLNNIETNHTVRVTFKLQVFTINPLQCTNGAITPNMPQKVAYGSTPTFTATPSAGYQVNTWLVDSKLAQTGGTQYTFDSVTANHSVKTTFKPLSFTITPTADSHGSITPNAPQAVDYGTNITLTAQPAAGYTVDYWLDNGKKTQIGGTQYQISSVTMDHTVKVAFKLLVFTVTPSADANGAITPNAPQSVNYGANLTFTASPNPGYQVDSWLLDDNVAQRGGTQYSLGNIAASHTVRVTFKLLTFTITPETDGNGTLNPGTPQTVAYNSNLTFTAMPATGMTVDGWFVDGQLKQTGQSTFTLTGVQADHTVKATFKVLTFTVTATAGANGSVSPQGAQTVVYNKGLTFTATPASGYAVDSWSVDGTVVQTGGTQFALTNVLKDHTVQVTFILTYTITPSAGANGTISPSTAMKVNAGCDCCLTASPRSGYMVDRWMVDGKVVQQNCTKCLLAKVSANHTVQVTFILAYTITTSAGANGAISPKDAQIVPKGSSQLFTAIPNTMYTVDSWYVDGKLVQSGKSTYTLTNITANHTVKVTFKMMTFTLTPSAGAYGTISPKTVQTVTYGTDFTFTATPNPGYVVQSWTVDGLTKQSGGTQFTLTHALANHNICVKFKKAPIPAQ